MGRKSRLKWERRKRDGWPLRGGAADVLRLMFESARRAQDRNAARMKVLAESFAKEPDHA